MIVNHPETEEFYSLQRLISTNREISVAMSIRNLGKSYSAEKMIRKHLDKGNNVCWSRWDAGELSVAINEIFGTERNYQDEYKKYKIEHTNGCFFENIETGSQCYFIPVKEANKFKGTDIPNFSWWVYDEFIPEFYDIKTRKVEEADKWNSLHTTLKRNNKNFRSLLMSNCITWFNGYTYQWDINPFPAGEIRFFNKGTVAFENIKPTKAMIERIRHEEELKGKASNLEAYLQNMTKDNMSLIAKCPDLSVSLFNTDFYLDGIPYSFRIHDGFMYWIEGKERDSYKVTLCNNDITADIRKDTQRGLAFESWYNDSKMRFENGHVESAIVRMIWESRKRL